MTIVPTRATATCKNATCKQKVRLTDDLVRELSAKLRVGVKCPKCQTEFVTSLIPAVKERPTPPPQAVTPPVPKDAARPPATPPFQSLTKDQPEPPPAPTPADTAPSPSAGVPFAPVDLSKPLPSAGGGAFGWWNRLPKKRQNLFLAVGLVLAGGFAVGMKFGGSMFGQRQPEQETQPEPVTPPPSPPSPPSTPATQPAPRTPPTSRAERAATPINPRPAPPRPTTPAPSDNPFNPNRGR